MSTSPSLNDHYSLLLGLDKHWEVEQVDCPQCQNACVMFDHVPEREWRHLDTMQFETVLRARVPRCQCKDCGVKTIAVPWAGKHSPFTWMFEALAVAVLQSAASTQEACALLDIGWEAAQRLMERAVAGSGLWTDAISPEVLFVRILEHF